MLDNYSKFTSVNSEYINSKICFSTDQSYKFLRTLLNVPKDIAGLFTKTSDFISTLTLYPFEINGAVDGEMVIYSGIGQVGSELDVVDTNIFGSWVTESKCCANLGEVFCNRIFNNFADYAGYTTIKLFLPFLGVIELPTNEVMGKWIQIRLFIDYNTGQGMYIIGVTDESLKQKYTADFTTSHWITPTRLSIIDKDTRIVSTHTCQLGITIPLGSGNAVDVYRNIINGAVRIGATVAGYGIGNALGASIGLSTTITDSSGHTEYLEAERTERNWATGRQVKAATLSGEKNISPSRRISKRAIDYSPRRASQTVNSCLDTASMALTSINIHGETTNPNNASVMSFSNNRPILIRYKPKIIPITDEYKKLYGLPLGKTIKLSEIGGYTEISQLHIEGEGFASATETEKEMLDNVLRSGIILPDKLPDEYDIYYNFSNVDITTKPTTIARVGGVETVEFTSPFKGSLDFSISGAEISNIFIDGSSSATMPTNVLNGTTIKFDISNALNDVNININVTPADREKFNIVYRLATESSSNITFINKPTEIYEGGSVTVTFRVNVSGTLTTALHSDSAPAILTPINYDPPVKVTSFDTIYQFELETTSNTNGDIIVRIGLT